MSFVPRVLDVTLRDGGCVNDFNFGNHYMRRILCALESAGIDTIEVGYLDSEKGSEFGRTKFCNEQVVKDLLLRTKKAGTTYLAMVDYGRFSIENLRNFSPGGIDGIRLAFHKKDWKDAIRLGRAILDKGYKLFVQPMLTLHYSDVELCNMLDAIIHDLPAVTAVYIVDSFGEMHESDLIRIAKLYDYKVPNTIAIGFHSHNNLQLSHALAIKFMEILPNRQLYVDSSLSGMGKGAGNLCTELLINYMQSKFGVQFNVRPILEAIDQVINVLRQETPWGYSLEYYLSSINHCSPSYASYFYNKQMLSVDQVGELLSKIDDAKKISFDRSYAENIYYDYKSGAAYDDCEVVERLRNLIRGNVILLIAPGRTIATHKNLINEYLDKEGVLSIGLNNVEFNSDFTIITRPDIYNANFIGLRTIITTSRITTKPIGKTLILDYHTWSLRKDRVHDSSAVVAMLLASRLGAKKIVLAGFDGFSTDVNDNYFDVQMRRPVLSKVVSARNEFCRWLIAEVRKTTDVVFATPSKYDQ